MRPFPTIVLTLIPLYLLAACSRDRAQGEVVSRGLVAATLDAVGDGSRVPAEAKGSTKWRLMTMVDENGKIPHDAQMDALKEMDKLRTERACGGLTATGWKEEGPGLVGGRVRAIAIDPNDSKRMFCGSVGGGIWYSSDSGRTWSQVDDRMENLAITCIQFDPLNTSRLLAATGEGFGNENSIRGAGIFRSVDKGVTWTRLPATNTPDFYYVNRVSIDMLGFNVLAATGTGIWHSGDFGTTWTKVLGGASTDVRFNPNDGKIAVAEIDVRPYCYHTTDGGKNWTASTGLSTGGDKRIEFAWSRGYNGSGNGVVYALTDWATTLTNNSSLMVSSDGGASFSLVNEGRWLGNQGWYSAALWVAPEPSNASLVDDILLIGGIDVWRSYDGGRNLTQVSAAWNWPKSPHADQHIIVEDPNYDGKGIRRIWIGNDGGICEASDITWVGYRQGWTRRNYNLGVTQFYGGSAHGTGILIGGAQDHGALRADVNTVYNFWGQLQTGDGGYCASDPTDANYHYYTTQNGSLYRSEDRGYSGRSIWNFKDANFVAPLALDPNNPQTLYFGAGALWRTTDIRAYNNFNFINLHENLVGGLPNPISAIGVMRGNSDHVWVGHNDGKIFRCTNATSATPSFTPKAQILLPQRMVTGITVDPKDADHVFAYFGGYASDNLWETSNGGSTWSVVNGVPTAPVRDLKFSSADSKVMYLATEVGLLATEDGGSTWCSSATPANVAIYQLFWGANNKLYAATHGRGIFSFELGSSGKSCIGTTFGGGAGMTATDCGSMFDITVSNPLGLKVTEIDVHPWVGYNIPVTVEVWITPGTYVGKDNDVSKWVQVSGGIGMTTATGRTRVDVRDFYLPAGKYGMCVLYASGGQRYTLGIGSNQSYGNADVFMSLGATKASRFGGSLDTNRVWNGAICYDAPDKATSGAYGFGCAGTGGVFPTFRLSSEPKLGASTSFDVNNMVSSGGPAWLYLGIIHTPGLDMGPFGMPGCSMFTFPTITVVGIPNSGGSTSIPVSIPNDPSLMFGIMGMQVFNVDAGASSPLGIAATAGHAIRIGN